MSDIECPKYGRPAPDMPRTRGEYPSGRGRIRCRVCGEPIRDHDGFGPCRQRPRREHAT